jgi:pimeloyl-ACP methyl ester carboxylesterase
LSPSTIKTTHASDGTRLEYEVLGAGPPLVALHGFLTGRGAFDAQRDALSARFRLILTSTRGHDGSEARVPPDYGMGGSEITDLQAILAAEGISACAMFAHSSGGATGFTFAVRFPERITRLVLIEPSLYALLPPEEFDRIAVRVQPVLDAEPAGAQAALRAALAVIGGAAWDALAPARQAKRLEIHASRAGFAAPNFRALLALPAREADVTGLRPPTLLIYGADSFSFEPFIAARFRALRPDIPIVTLERAGHNPHRDRPDAVNPLLLRFLADS